jgi:hypothetical protein
MKKAVLLALAISGQRRSVSGPYPSATTIPGTVSARGATFTRAAGEGIKKVRKAVGVDDSTVSRIKAAMAA